MPTRVSGNGKRLRLAALAISGLLLSLVVLVGSFYESEAQFDKLLSKMERLTFPGSGPENSGILRRDFFGLGSSQVLSWHAYIGRAKWDTSRYEFSGEGIEETTVLLYSSDPSVKTGLWLDSSGSTKRLVVYQPLFLNAGKLSEDGFPAGFWELRVENGKVVRKPMKTSPLSLWMRNLWPFA